MRLEIATGGDPARAVVAALIHHRALPRGGATLVGVSHDDGCPCVEKGAPTKRCTCAFLELEIVRLGRG
jgi:hypothetical protein